MKYEPLVSIVIPAYNASNYLADAIESALAQTYKNIEIIVVNDGSKDNGATAIVAKKYEGKIRYFEKENGGSSSAMNLGIKNMKGDWFSWLSHDDLYYPEKIQEEIELLNSLNIDYNNDVELQRHLFFAAADLIDSDGNYISKKSPKKLHQISEQLNREDSNLYLIAEPVQSGFHGCSCLIHRKAFEIIGGFDEKLRLLNDMDLWFRFYSHNYKIHFIPKSLVMGRVHGSQVSKSIGFSYHNVEQDMFWIRNLEWLKQNQPENYDLFYIYGKTALSKTRYENGKDAFDFAAKIKPQKKIELKFKRLIYILKAEVWSLGKKVYLKIKT